MTETFIACTDVSKVYGDGAHSVTALKNIHLDLPQNTFTALTGPSGSGKTTLLNLIGTLDQPTSGEIVVDGVRIADLKDDQLADFRRECIGFVFQSYNLLPTLTVLENVMIPLLPYRKQLSFLLEERAREIVGQLGLRDRINYLPGELSGGEQQRVAIARALIHSPRLILADEPTGNLDSTTGTEVVNILKQLKETAGVTVLMVTHNPQIAAQAERVISLLDGEIIPQKAHTPVNQIAYR